jgi:hypothetical protein
MAGNLELSGRINGIRRSEICVEGCGMARWLWRCADLAMLTGFLLSGIARPACGQEIRTIIEARSRAFPAIGPGVTALRRDSSGRYYVLAKPATVIFLYDAEGKPAGQIPNANSKGATIKYAVDFDISPDGLLFVADRGSNTVEVFKPDGSLTAKIPVVAPTSVVALSDGQFAFTSLVSKRLVQVRDVQGNMVRTFGDPTDVDDDVARKPVMDMGRISGDSADHVYFAFTSVDDPTLRSYDRYGYVGYEAKVPENAFAGAPGHADDRVEFGVSVTHFSLSEQTAGSLTVGTSGDVRFSGGMGTGLLGSMRSGGGFGRAALSQSMMPGSGGLFGAGGGGGTFMGMLSGEVTSQGDTQFQLGLGRMAGFRSGGQGRSGGGGTSSGQANSQGGFLHFYGSGYSYGSDFVQPDMTNAFSSSALQSANGDPDDGPFAGVNLGLQFGDNGDLEAGSNPSQGLGLPSAFVVASTLNSREFRPSVPPGGFVNDLHDDAAKGGSPSFLLPSAMGNKGGGPGSYDRYGPHGRYGGETGLTASMRVNIGDLGKSSEGKPVITAVGVDPATHEIWAAVGDALVHFNKSGDPSEMYYLTMKGGAPLKATAVLVENDRILVAGDPWGIFEFARPDKPALTAPLRFNAVPERVSNPQ